MNSEPDPLNDFSSSSISRFESSRPAGIYPRYHEPASALPGRAGRSTTAPLENHSSKVSQLEQQLAEQQAQNQKLNDFISSTAGLSTIQETGSLMERIAAIARRLLESEYALVVLYYQDDWIRRSSGYAPLIDQSLSSSAVSFLENAIQAPYTFKMRDLRSDERSACIQLDRPELRSLLVTPIYIKGLRAGLILVFGKTSAEAFSDQDVRIADMLSQHAAFNIDSCFNNSKLRYELKTNQLLSSLSIGITEANQIQTAAWVIARTADNLLQPQRCGLVLFDGDGKTVMAEVHFPIEEAVIHPMKWISQAMDSRQTLYLAEADLVSRIVIPIQTPRRCFGALWLDLEEIPGAIIHPAEDLQVVINQSAIALERLVLLEEMISQSLELQATNIDLRKIMKNLEQAYDDTLTVLMRALDARDSETEDHTRRVTQLARRLGIAMGLTEEDIKTLERGAILHDIGKIGVEDAILNKPGALSASEWEQMRKHPDTGADIIREVPFLEKVVPIIKYHQERWNGSGYPEHRRGTEIPLLARIFAVVDVFDAIISKRPYKEARPKEEALAFLEQESGILFDPVVVTRFVRLINETDGIQSNELSTQRI